jgi:hypothetical protein
MPTSDGEQLDPIIRLDNEQLDVTVYDDQDDIKNIASDTLIFEARIKKTDTAPLIRKTSEDIEEIEKLDAAQGKARVYIDPADTQPITKDYISPGLYCTLTTVDVVNRASSILFNLPIKFRF